MIVVRYSGTLGTTAANRFLHLLYGVPLCVNLGAFTLCHIVHVHLRYLDMGCNLFVTLCRRCFFVLSHDLV